MAGYCLPSFAAAEFKKALKTGEISPGKLAVLTSAERRAIFGKYMNEMQAQNTNALFESKLLLKNQQKGMISWAKKVAGITPETRRDMIAKVERLGKVLEPEELDAFMEDLVEKRLGFNVTPKEAENLSKLANKIEETKARIPENSPIDSKARLDYGANVVAFKVYVDELKTAAKAGKLLSLETAAKLPEQIGNNAKSLVASGDFSAFGNQGIKVLLTNPEIWLKNFAKLPGNVIKALGGKDPLKEVWAGVMSRPNSINGKYETAGAHLSLLREEAYPGTIAEKLPVFDRLLKASDVAYNGAILGMRADYMDKVIKTAERLGVDMTDPEQARGLGHLVNSLTGRGNLGKLEPAANNINALLFSPRFLKSNIDTLFFGLTDKEIRNNPLALKIAAGNTVKIAASIGLIMAFADRVAPGSVEWDPRSSDFGKIKVGNTRFDVTGGASSLAVLGSRMVPQWDEKLGRWVFKTKSSNTGKITTLGSGEYGSKTALDVFEDFWEGKAAPAVGFFRDLAKSEFYDRTPFRFVQGGFNLIKPIPFDTVGDLLKDPEAADYLIGMIAASLFVPTNTYSK